MSDAIVSDEKEAAAPFGTAGKITRRGKRGQFAAGNTDAVVVGEHSPRFWTAKDAAIHEIVDRVIADKGHTRENAATALLIGSESLAQAVMVQRSAFERMAECGGPLASSGRARRVFTVWLAAVDRVEKHLRLIGLSRVPAPVETPLQWMERHD